MPDISTQIKTAIGDEPPFGFGPGDVIAAARKVRRRRRAGFAAAAAGAAAVTAGAVLALPGSAASQPAGSTAPGHTTEMSLTSLSRIAAQKPTGTPRGLPTARVEGVTAAEVFALFAKDTGVGVTAAQASLLRPADDLDLAAGVAVPGSPYLNIQVMSKDSLITAEPSCAELSALASGNGDGFYGPCSIKRLPDGSIFIVRSGETRQGHYTMAQATLIRPDGSGVFAEDTNQAMQSPGDTVKEKEQQAKSGKPVGPPVVSVNPPVNAATLGAFVRDVASRS